MFHIKCPEKIFFKDIEIFPDTQKLYISSENVERM